MSEFFVGGTNRNRKRNNLLQSGSINKVPLGVAEGKVIRFGGRISARGLRGQLDRQGVYLHDPLWYDYRVSAERNTMGPFNGVVGPICTR